MFEGSALTIRSTGRLGTKRAKWDRKNTNNHRITVEYEGNKTTFDFWCSLAQPTFQNEDELIHALSCFASDACSGEMSFKEFCNEFGYEETEENDFGRIVPNEKARNIHRACENARETFEYTLQIDNNDLYNFLLEEYEDCM